MPRREFALISALRSGRFNRSGGAFTDPPSAPTRLWSAAMQSFDLEDSSTAHVFMAAMSAGLAAVVALVLLGLTLGLR